MSRSADAACPCYDSLGDKRVGAHMCVSARVCLNVFLGEDDILQDEFGGSDTL